MTIEDCAAAARLYWTTEEDLVLAVAIAGCESGWVNNAAGDPLASFSPDLQIPYDAYDCDGYLSFGLWQIFLPAHWSSLTTAFATADPCAIADRLFDPRTSAQQAFRIQRTQGWTAWTCYNTGAYRAYTEQARTALGALLAVDDFEVDLSAWSTFLSGTGASAVISTARARSGTHSALLTAGSTITRVSALSRRPPFPGPSLLALKYSFSLGSPIESLRWHIYVNTGSYDVWYTVRWRDDNDTLEYADSTGSFVPFATGIGLLPDPATWHTGKLLVDPTTLQYVGFTLDSVTYSLQGIVAENQPFSQAPILEIFITLTGRAGFNDTVYVDDASLSQGAVGAPAPYTFPNPFDPALYYALAEVEPHPPGFPIVW